MNEIVYYWVRARTSNDSNRASSISKPISKHLFAVSFLWNSDMRDTDSKIVIFLHCHHMWSWCEVHNTSFSGENALTSMLMISSELADACMRSRRWEEIAVN